MLKFFVAILLCISSAFGARTFPSDFKFGVATASYQIEGAWNADGKGRNIWDYVCHTNPDFIVNRDNGDVACDSYHKWEEDVRNIKALGVDFYRFSLSWSRILPTGYADLISLDAVNYYRNLIQGLLDEGIEPLVTIFHWDTPQSLEDLGGWRNESIVTLFEDYASVAFEMFGDLVKTWLTFNEPKQTCHEGYGTGGKAPGLTLSGLDEYLCTHNLLKAHARAWHLYDEQFRAQQNGRVGITIDLAWCEPANVTANSLDDEAAERCRQFIFGWYANPIFNRNYPQVMIDRIGNRSAAEGYPQSRLPAFTEEELNYISGTFDYMGANFYTADLAQWQEDAPIGEVNFDNDLGVLLYKDPQWEGSASSWLKVTPWAFRKFLSWLKLTYNNPEIIITENGVSDYGTLEDQSRINYYHDYLSSVLDAINEDAVNITGYTAWSLMDNFEWRSGYSEHFGLYLVNFTDPERPRTPKQSAEWFKNLVATHCLDECSSG